MLDLGFEGGKRSEKAGVVLVAWRIQVNSIHRVMKVVILNKGDFLKAKSSVRSIYKFITNDYVPSSINA